MTREDGYRRGRGLPPGAITPGCTNVLLALIDIHATKGRVTIREICDVTGQTPGNVHPHLVTLLGEGLVDWSENKRGTLRPTVSVIR